jgi:hypothetical protein
MDDLRLERALLIPMTAVTFHVIKYSPLLIVATIQGQELYSIVIDEHSGVNHDCPDFKKRKLCCKHLGRLISLFSLPIQSRIIEIFEQNQKNTASVTLEKYDALYRNFLNIEFLQRLPDYLPDMFSSDSPVGLYFQNVLFECLKQRSKEIMYKINEIPQIHGELSPILKNMAKPLPDGLYQLQTDPNLSLQTRQMISECLFAIDTRYSIKLKNRRILVL